MSVTNIHEESAKRVYQELLMAIGSENNTAQWLVFMRCVKKHLPFLCDPEKTKPTKEQIESSVIGRLGFKSWGEMVTSSKDDRGLGWSLDKWKAWKKAFNVVNRVPYLENMGFSASHILALNKSLGGEFPDSSLEMENKKRELAKAKLAEKAVRQNELIERVRELESQLLVAQSKNEELTKQNDSMVQIVSDFKPLVEKLSIAERGSDELRQINNQLKLDMNKLNDEKKMLSQNIEKLMAANKQWEHVYNNKGVVGWLKGLFGNK